MKLESPIRICLIASQGGHMKQMHLLEKCYKEYPYFLITVRNKEAIKACDHYETHYFVTNICEGRWKKSFFSLLKAFWEVYKIYCCQKPTLVISTGSGIAVPGFIVAKLMKIKTIYVEAGAKVYTLSKTGRVCYCISDLFFVQHLPLARKYSKAIYKGILYKHLGN
jgi:UDP-N-acetylglucosamine:LPS N-acetylglucosamine transferase